MEQNIQGHELVDSLDDLSSKQELHDDPNTHYTMRCPGGTKSFKRTCVKGIKPVRAQLNEQISKSLTQVRARVMSRGGTV